MAFIMTPKGRLDTPITFQVHQDARAANMTVEQYLNRKHANEFDPQYGSPFKQILASEGLTGGDNAFGLRSPTLGQLLSQYGFDAAANVEKKSDPFGNQSRALFPIAVIAAIEDAVQPDRETDNRVFRGMAATTLPIASDTFSQPILDYSNPGGANAGVNQARAGRVTELGQVPTILTLTTSDKNYTIPTYGIGVEMSDKALNNTSLDLFTMTLNRFFEIEKDARVYRYISQLFAGDTDQGYAAIAAVTSTTLNGAVTSGVMTHKAWVKYLALKRKTRHLNFHICDIDTYLKIESRTGRPGSNAYDPSLARIDPQLVPAGNIPFGADVTWMIVDAAADGGPVPASTVWSLDSSQAFMFVENTEASYQATEEFVLRRSKSMVWHWSEDVRRLYPTDTTAFAVLTID